MEGDWGDETPEEAAAREAANLVSAATAAWGASIDEAARQQLPTSPPQDASAGSQRRTSLRWDWSGPFARPEMVSPSRQQVEDDIDMESVGTAGVQPKEDKRITNAPTLPLAPVYKGCTMDNRRVFMRAYQTYVRSLSAFETTLSRPFVMPVSACIEDRTRWLIAHYTIRKPVGAITEAEWEQHFLAADEAETRDYEAIDEAMRKSLKMDVTLKDASSRMAKMVQSMHNILDQFNLELVLANEEPERLVKYLLDGLEPSEFRTKIKHRLSHDSNKKYRKDTALFVDWVTKALKSCLLWEPKIEPRGQKPPAQGGRRSSRKCHHAQVTTAHRPGTQSRQPARRRSRVVAGRRRGCPV